MEMKKANLSHFLLIVFAMVVLLPMIIIPVSANAGPTYMYAEPGMGITVNTDCPIVVTHEDLTFDLSGPRGTWGPLAQVKAAYSMKNPTDETQIVQMAFPYITEFAPTTDRSVRVYENGSAVDCEIYYGGVTKNEEDINTIQFDDILSNVIISIPDEPEDGMLYTLNIDTSSVPEGTERIHVRMDLEYEGEFCLTSGFTGGTFYDDGTASLVTWYYLERVEEPISVFVPGGRLFNYSAATYESYDSDEPLDYASISFDVKTTSMRDFVTTVLSNSEYVNYTEFSESMYWAMLTELANEEYVRQYNGTVSVSELYFNVRSRPRLALAVYDVEFAPGEDRDITVMSNIEGTMNRPSGYSNRGMNYTYTYMSNPASHWADFGTMNIIVIPPDDEELSLTSAYPELTLNNDGTYSAELDRLPDENIRFTFSTPDGDGVAAIFDGSTFIFLLVLTFAALIVVTIVLLLRKHRRKAAA
jgi:hypothetical protein